MVLVIVHKTPQTATSRNLNEQGNKKENKINNKNKAKYNRGYNGAIRKVQQQN